MLNADENYQLNVYDRMGMENELDRIEKLEEKKYLRLCS